MVVTYAGPNGFVPSMFEMLNVMSAVAMDRHSDMDAGYGALTQKYDICISSMSQNTAEMNSLIADACSCSFVVDVVTHLA